MAVLILVVTLVGWALLFVVIALFETFVYGYKSPIDWWYCCIDKNPRSGVWYYGSLPAAQRRIRER